MTREYTQAGLERLIDERVEHATKAAKAAAWARPSESVKAALSAASGGESRPRGEVSALGGLVTALAAGKGNVNEARSYAQKTEMWGVEKALAAGDSGAGGFLIPDEILYEVIEFLHARSVVRRLNPTGMLVPRGTTRVARTDQTSTGQWIGENTNAPATQPAFGQVVLSLKKLAAVVPISNDLINRASPATTVVVQNDLIGSMAATLDIAYIRGPGTSAQPLGIRNQSGIQTFASAGTTADNILADLNGAVRRLMDANVRMIRPGWMFAPRTWAALISARATEGFYFKEEMAQGQLRGFPFQVTSQIPSNLGGGGDESEVFLVDFADVLVGEFEGGIRLDASGDAAYHDGVNVQAAFSLDQTVVRAIWETDLALRHPESVVVITGVQWA